MKEKQELKIVLEEDRENSLDTKKISREKQQELNVEALKLINSSSEETTALSLERKMELAGSVDEARRKGRTLRISVVEEDQKEFYTVEEARELFKGHENVREIGDFIGDGSFGGVYIGKTEYKREVVPCAIKIPRIRTKDKKKVMGESPQEDERVIKSFFDEGKIRYTSLYAIKENMAAAKRIVQIYDVGLFKGIPYVTMELVEGKTLEELTGEEMKRRKMLREKGLELDPEEKRKYEVDSLLYHIGISEALQAFFKTGYAHRDVKPGNIIIQENGLERKARLTDMGLVKVSDFGEIETLEGSPHFMSPEQFYPILTPEDREKENNQNLREIGPPSDVYSWGASLIRTLTGRSHTGIGAQASMKEIASRTLGEVYTPFYREMPFPIAVLADACLERDPFKRPNIVKVKYAGIGAAIECGASMDQITGQFESISQDQDNNLLREIRTFRNQELRRLAIMGLEATNHHLTPNLSKTKESWHLLKEFGKGLKDTWISPKDYYQ